MMCWSARRRMVDYVDGRLRASERSRVAAHLRNCASCSVNFEQNHAVRSALGSLPRRVAPPILTTVLRVRASQERQALLGTRGSRLQQFWDMWKMRLDDLMRPLTIPATGGLLSSLVLFGALAFTIGNAGREAGYEVPLGYLSRIDANLVPMQLSSSVTLTLSLDGNGHITDYAAHDASRTVVGDATRLQGNDISMPQFPSVLVLSHRISSDISIQFTPIVFRQ